MQKAFDRAVIMTKQFCVFFISEPNANQGPKYFIIVTFRLMRSVRHLDCLMKTLLVKRFRPSIRNMNPVCRYLFSTVF